MVACKPKHLTATPTSTRSWPRARDAGPVHPERLYRAVKRFFATAADAAQRASTPHARAFLAASPHWLRHTFASHALANGVSLESVRIFLGHASLGTTTIYSAVELARQYREAELFLREAMPAGTPRAAAGSTPPERGDPVPAAATATGGSAPTATVHVTLRVAPKRPGGRGQVRALERVEREVLAGFVRTPTHQHTTALQVPFDGTDVLDRTVDDLMVAIALIAEQQRCVSESEACADVNGARWTW